MKHKTLIKLFLPLLFLTLVFGCSTVKGWFGGKNPIGPRTSWPMKASTS